MKRQFLHCWLLLAIVGLSGCGAKVEETAPPADDNTTRLGETTDINLKAWLEEPRSKLAELSRDTQDRVENALKIARTDGVALLPNLRLPLTVPVLREAAYAKTVSISLPPYVKAGEHDSGLALHLARHGDVEAALKLVDPTDAEAIKQIEASRLGRNYPVEWTRLVGLTLLEAQLKMAQGDLDGATELVLVHKQLRTLLDGQAATSPLGAALLPIGQRALKAAVAEWRDGSHKLPVVAEQADAALKDWGAGSAPKPALLPGASREAVAELFHQRGQGRLLAAKTPAAMKRVLDLGNLAIIDEGLVGILAWFDDKDHLQEFWGVYRSQIGRLFPEPIHLAHLLADSGVQGKDPETVAGLPKQSYPTSDFTYDVMLLPKSPTLGALVRLTDPKAGPLAAVFPKSPRDFGAINLARSFERTREELAPTEKAAKQFEIKTKEALAQIKAPASDVHLTSATLEKAGDHDLLAGLRLSWSQDDNLVAFANLLWPLWETYGPCRFESLSNHLEAIWEGEPLRVTLVLPYNQGQEAPELIVRDQRGPRDAAERLKEALTLDQQHRQSRWEASKPLTRLPRYLQWPALELGQSRNQVASTMPRDVKFRTPVKAADGSFSILVTSAAPAAAPQFPQQVVLRFGADDKLAEVRIRYEQRSAKPNAANPALLEVLKKAGGEPEAIPAPWAATWADQTTGKGPAAVCYRWTDDRTVLTYQRDGNGLEVVLTDCPLASPKGIALPPLELCSRGSEGCHLGDTRDELLKRWKISQPKTTGDGGLLLFPPAKSPYELAVVYFVDNKVVRILARHRAAPSTGEDHLADLQKIWLADLDRLGSVRRVLRVLPADGDRPVTTGYGWNDDRTRVFTFAAKDSEGKHLFTEWRSLPLPLTQTAAVKR